MATTKKAAASKKELIIVAIYKFKTNGKLNGTVCTLIRSTKVVKGEQVTSEHKVWTHANGCAPHCDCDGFEKTHGKRRCCHIAEALKAAEARKAAVVATPVPPVVAQPQVTVQPVIETADTEEAAKQPAVAERKMSSVEASMPAWMLTGRSSNGTFAGRGTQEQEEQERIALRDSLQARAPHNKFSWKYASKTA